MLTILMSSLVLLLVPLRPHMVSIQTSQVALIQLSPLAPLLVPSLPTIRLQQIASIPVALFAAMLPQGAVLLASERA